MKLIQKKCPNCGAPLKFDENDHIALCGYCKQRISITRKKSNSIDDDYLLMVKSHYKGRYYQEKVGKLVAIFLALIICGVIVIFFAKGFGNSEKIEEPPIVEKKYITDLSQMDSESLGQISSKSLESLGEKKIENVRQTDWKPIGQYFLKHKKDSKENKLYDIYVKEYVIDGKTIRGYAGVEYFPLEISDENVLLIPYRGKTICPSKIVEKETIFGYESNEDFYNDIIRNQTSSYMVSGTGNLYLEKINN